MQHHLNGGYDTHGGRLAHPAGHPQPHGRASGRRITRPGVRRRVPQGVERRDTFLHPRGTGARTVRLRHRRAGPPPTAGGNGTWKERKEHTMSRKVEHEFSEATREYLERIPAVEKVGKTRITYAAWFRREALRRYRRGGGDVPPRSSARTASDPTSSAANGSNGACTGGGTARRTLTWRKARPKGSSNSSNAGAASCGTNSTR